MTRRKCVLFLGTKEKGKFSPRATAFVVSIIENPLGGGFHYLVTAQHVISRFHDERLHIWVRSNLKNGRALENLLAGRWWFHPDNALSPNDVAVISIDFVSDEDFLLIPLSGPAAMAATSEIFNVNSIGVGHEVFITGLFRTHYGNQRNVPIVRVGNISMMPGEPGETKYCGDIDAYLIEARSIGGLSGSPVFVNIGVFGAATPRNDFVPYLGERIYLLGLMHGHFDIQNLNDDVVIEAGTTQRINTGIG